MDEQTKTILVVDDDVLFLRLIELALQSEGYEVYTAANGEIGLAKAHALQPKVVILDIMMPGIDGYEVCQRLKTDPSTAGISVLMFSAKGDVAAPGWAEGNYVSNAYDRLRGFEMGADDFLSKPVHLQELIRRVEALI